MFIEYIAFTVEIIIKCLFWSVAKNKRTQELILLRKELQILKRQTKKPKFNNIDRFFYISLMKNSRKLIKKCVLVKPETIIAWHKKLIKKKWNFAFKDKGRPPVSDAVKNMILEMKAANSRWGSKKISGELLKLGIKACKKTVAKILKDNGFSPTRKNCNQSWFTFLKNQTEGVYLACDFFTVETLFLKNIYVFFIIDAKSREIITHAVTDNPTRFWLENVVTTSFCLKTSLPLFMVSDRDGIYGEWFGKFLKEYFDIKLLRIPPRQPIFNCYAERMVKTFREELTDRCIIYNKRHLRKILSAYCIYYNQHRSHSSLEFNAPTKQISKNLSFVPSKVVRKKILNGSITDFSLAV